MSGYEVKNKIRNRIREANQRSREKILEEQMMWASVKTDGEEGWQKVETSMVDSDEVVESAYGILEGLYKQRERIEHLLKVTHSTDTLTKLWNNYVGVTNSILSIMDRYGIC